MEGRPANPASPLPASPRPPPAKSRTSAKRDKKEERREEKEKREEREERKEREEKKEREKEREEKKERGKDQKDKPRRVRAKQGSVVRWSGSSYVGVDVEDTEDFTFDEEGSVRANLFASPDAFLPFLRTLQFADVTLVAQDGVQFRAHQLLLAYASLYFYELFLGAPPAPSPSPAPPTPPPVRPAERSEDEDDASSSSASEEESELPPPSPDAPPFPPERVVRLSWGHAAESQVFPQLLQFIYSAHLPLTVASCVPLMAAARHYRIVRLQAAIRDYFRSTLQRETALPLLLATVEHAPHVGDMQDAALAVVARNFAFLDADYTPLEPTLFLRIVRHRKLAVRSEFALYGTICAYLEARQVPLPLAQQLLSHVRYRFCSYAELERVVRNPQVPPHLLIEVLMLRLKPHELPLPSAPAPPEPVPALPVPPSSSSAPAPPSPRPVPPESSVLVSTLDESTQNDDDLPERLQVLPAPPSLSSPLIPLAASPAVADVRVPPVAAVLQGHRGLDSDGGRAHGVAQSAPVGARQGALQLAGQGQPRHARRGGRGRVLDERRALELGQPRLWPAPARGAHALLAAPRRQLQGGRAALLGAAGEHGRRRLAHHQPPEQLLRAQRTIRAGHLRRAGGRRGVSPVPRGADGPQLLQPQLPRALRPRVLRQPARLGRLAGGCHARHQSDPAPSV